MFENKSTLSLYIHIPFCRAKCNYCDFVSYAGLEEIYEDYVQALCREITYTAPATDSVVQTIYIGGGTPTVLTVEQIARILDTCHRDFTLTPNAEITIEANPGTIDEAYLRGLHEIGINRLSLGVQSFDDDMLRNLGRIHTALEARETYRQARVAGFDNINLDFIYGLPGQTLAHWQDTLEQALALLPDHLALYALTVEENTPLGAAVKNGEMTAPSEDLMAEMYKLAEKMLHRARFTHYEISNWAKLGASDKVSRHNLTYWRNLSYWGLGAAAHSCYRNYRYHNAPTPQEYIAQVNALSGAAAEIPDPQLHEVDNKLEPRDVMAEMMILGLRLDEGVSFDEFAARFGCELGDVYGETIQELVDLELLDVMPHAVLLTARGRLLSNQVFYRFL